MKNKIKKIPLAIPLRSKYKNMTLFQYQFLYGLFGRERTRYIARHMNKWKCQDCGLVRTPEMCAQNNLRMLDIHHINGLCGKRSKHYDRIEDIKNLVTLCHKCHFNRPEHACKKKKRGSGQLTGQ
jgi:hypothetical protein